MYKISRREYMRCALRMKMLFSLTKCHYCGALPQDFAHRALVLNVKHQHRVDRHDDCDEPEGADVRMH